MRIFERILRVGRGRDSRADSGKRGRGNERGARNFRCADFHIEPCNRRVLRLLRESGLRRRVELHSVGSRWRGYGSDVSEKNKGAMVKAAFRRHCNHCGGEDVVCMIEAVVGLLTGVIASMGLGGGFILVVWLTVFAEVEQKAAQGINLLFFLPIAFISLIIHIKNGLVNKTLVKKLALGGILGAVIGTFGAMWIDNSLLRKLFAVFLLVFGLKELFSRNPEKNTDKVHRGES